VEVSADGDTAFQKASTQGFDAAVVDVMIPGRSGVQLVRDLRAAGHAIPVLLLTARDRTEDKVEGLDSGADDYVRLQRAHRAAARAAAPAGAGG
jgi:DNA-binding response OmpR family regulator